MNVDDPVDSSNCFIDEELTTDEPARIGYDADGQPEPVADDTAPLSLDVRNTEAGVVALPASGESAADPVRGHERLRRVVRVHLDPLPYEDKPARSEGKKIQERLLANAVECTVEDLAQHLAAGHAFTPALFRDGRRTKETWHQQQVFALDFDHGCSLEVFLHECRRWGIGPAFVYATYSYTPEAERFRAVFVHREAVTDRRIRNLVQGLLMRMFPTCDRQCKDEARLFFGGKALLHTDYDATVDVLDLLNRVQQELRRSSPSNYSHKLKTLAKEFSLGIRNHDLGVELVVDEDEEIALRSTSSASQYYSYIYSDDQFVEFGNEAPDTHHHVGSGYRKCFRIAFVEPEERGSFDGAVELAQPEGIQDEDREGADGKAREKSPYKHYGRLDENAKSALTERCRLLRDFVGLERRLHHHELFLLITNLLRLEGGEQLFFNMLGARPDYNNDVRRKTPQFREIVRYIRTRGYRPEGCASGKCPYAERCVPPLNLLQQLPLRRRGMRQVDPAPPARTLVETRRRLREAVQSADAAVGSAVFVIRCEPGVGKTEALLDLPLSHTAVALPTHRLKEEVHARALRKGVQDVYVWRGRPMLPAPYEERLQRLEFLGLEEQASALVEDIVEGKVNGVSAEVVAACQAYRQSLEEVGHRHPLFVTHEKLVRLSNPNVEKIIVDEDIVSSLLKISTVETEDLLRLREVAQVSTDRSAAELIARLDKALVPKPFVVDAGPVSRGALKLAYTLMDTLVSDLSTPVAAILTCGHWTWDDHAQKILCIERRATPTNTKHIVLSATAHQPIYERLYRGRIVFTDLGRTQPKGRLAVHPERSYSRTWIRKNFDEFVASARRDRDRYGFEGVITFKFLAEEIDGKQYLKGTQGEIPVLATFGALEGLDRFGGSSFAVYGTPYPPPAVLRLYAAALGYPRPAVNRIGIRPSERPVTRHGFEFYISRYSDDPDVLELQLFLIERELMQAVGRARLLEHDAHVHLFARFPLPGATLAVR